MNQSILNKVDTLLNSIYRPISERGLLVRLEDPESSVLDCVEITTVKHKLAQGVLCLDYSDVTPSHTGFHVRTLPAGKSILLANGRKYSRQLTSYAPQLAQLLINGEVTCRTIGSALACGTLPLQALWLEARDNLVARETLIKRIGGVSRNKVASFKKAHLLDRNKDATVLIRDGTQGTAIEDTVYGAFLRSCWSLLEVPGAADSKKTRAFIDTATHFMDVIGFPHNSRNFALRIKKLGHYRTQGFWFQEANTMILDPRYVDTFVHELGHLIFDSQVEGFDADRFSDSEKYADAFERKYITLWK